MISNSTTHESREIRNRHRHFNQLNRRSESESVLLLRLVSLVSEMKQRLSLLAFVDSTNPIHTLQLLFLEIDEVIEELELFKNSLDYSQNNKLWAQKVAAEVCDIIVLAGSYLYATDRIDLLFKTSGTVNGFAKNELVFLESLSEQTGHVIDTHRQTVTSNPRTKESKALNQALEQYILLLRSLVMHFPGMGHAAYQAMVQTVEKVSGNRPALLYRTTENVNGNLNREVSEAQNWQKYRNLEKIQRLFRDSLGRNVTEADWHWLMTHVTLDWEQVDSTLAAMKHFFATDPTVSQRLNVVMTDRGILVYGKTNKNNKNNQSAA